MQVRNTLADTIVDRHKRSFRLHALLYCLCQQLHIAEKRSAQIRGKVRQCFEMLLRDQQNVTGEQWTIVQKRKRDGILEYDVRR